MKEISQQEYDVLKNFVPTKVRYFVEVPKSAVRQSNGKAPRNQRVHMTTKPPFYAEGTQIQRLYGVTKSILNNDPTQIIGRADLAKQICRKVNDKKTSVFRGVTKMIEDGLLTPVEK